MIKQIGESMMSSPHISTFTLSIEFYVKVKKKICKINVSAKILFIKLDTASAI